MNIRFTACILATGLALAAPQGAQAAVSLGIPAGGSFVEYAPVAGSGGNYGVELRVGNNATNGTWEIGAGERTSNAGLFNQAQFAWASPTQQAFTLNWTNTSVSITIGATTVSYAAPLAGNTLNVFIKRDADITFDDVDGASGFGQFTSADGGNVYFLTDDAWGGDGLSVTGTLRIGTGQGSNSASGIQFKLGTTTLPVAVPEPATLALLGLGLVGLGFARRRRLV